jgi:hypothetical protein
VILFDLVCRDGHRFEGWFASSDAYAAQQAAGMLRCVCCGTAEVGKAVMAPAVARKGSQTAAPAKPDRASSNDTAGGPAPAPALDTEKAAALAAALAAAQARALAGSTWVGKAFADEARAIHYGETAARTIHGEASLAEARALAEEGVPCTPLPFPVTDPRRAH